MSEWKPIADAKKERGKRYLGWLDCEIRVIAWGKNSHTSWVGWCLADQGVEDFDLVQPTMFHEFPAPPAAEDA